MGVQELWCMQYLCSCNFELALWAKEAGDHGFWSLSSSISRQFCTMISCCSRWQFEPAEISRIPPCVTFWFHSHFFLLPSCQVHAAEASLAFQLWNFDSLGALFLCVKFSCCAYLCLCTSSSTCSNVFLSLAQGELLSGLLQAKIERDELTTLFFFHVLLNIWFGDLFSINRETFVVLFLRILTQILPHGQISILLGMGQRESIRKCNNQRTKNNTLQFTKPCAEDTREHKVCQRKMSTQKVLESEHLKQKS